MLSFHHYQLNTTKPYDPTVAEQKDRKAFEAYVAKAYGLDKKPKELKALLESKALDQAWAQWQSPRGGFVELPRETRLFFGVASMPKLPADAGAKIDGYLKKSDWKGLGAYLAKLPDTPEARTLVAKHMKPSKPGAPGSFVNLVLKTSDDPALRLLLVDRYGPRLLKTPEDRVEVMKCVVHSKSKVDDAAVGLILSWKSDDAKAFVKLVTSALDGGFSPERLRQNINEHDTQLLATFDAAVRDYRGAQLPLYEKRIDALLSAGSPTDAVWSAVGTMYSEAKIKLSVAGEGKLLDKIGAGLMKEADPLKTAGTLKPDSLKYAAIGWVVAAQGGKGLEEAFAQFPKIATRGPNNTVVYVDPPNETARKAYFRGMVDYTNNDATLVATLRAFDGKGKNVAKSVADATRGPQALREALELGDTQTVKALLAEAYASGDKHAFAALLANNAPLWPTLFPLLAAEPSPFAAEALVHLATGEPATYGPMLVDAPLPMLDLIIMQQKGTSDAEKYSAIYVQATLKRHPELGGVVAAMYALADKYGIPHSEIDVTLATGKATPAIAQAVAKGPKELLAAVLRMEVDFASAVKADEGQLRASAQDKAPFDAQIKQRDATIAADQAKLAALEKELGQRALPAPVAPAAPAVIDAQLAQRAGDYADRYFAAMQKGDSAEMAKLGAEVVQDPALAQATAAALADRWALAAQGKMGANAKLTDIQPEELMWRARGEFVLRYDGRGQARGTDATSLGQGLAAFAKVTVPETYKAAYEAGFMRLAADPAYVAALNQAGGAVTDDAMVKQRGAELMAQVQPNAGVAVAPAAPTAPVAPGAPADAAQVQPTPAADGPADKGPIKETKPKRHGHGSANGFGKLAATGATFEGHVNIAPGPGGAIVSFTISAGDLKALAAHGMSEDERVAYLEKHVLKGVSDPKLRHSAAVTLDDYTSKGYFLKADGIAVKQGDKVHLEATAYYHGDGSKEIITGGASHLVKPVTPVAEPTPQVDVVAISAGGGFNVMIKIEGKDTQAYFYKEADANAFAEKVKKPGVTMADVDRFRVEVNPALAPSPPATTPAPAWTPPKKDSPNDRHH